MSPDLNSLPPSRPPSSPRQPRTLPASAVSPASSTTTTTMNNNINNNITDLSRRSSRTSPRTRLSISEHRRSAVGTNSNPNESAIGDLPPSDHRSSMSHAFRTASPTSIGGSPVIATGDPHHQRAPSLGELHQELEQEQEAQVNRLLQMIRSQQAQLQQLQQQQQQQHFGTAIIEDSTPPSEHSASIPPLPPLSAPASRTSAQFPSSFSSHRSSRPSSRTASPSLRPVPSASLHGTSVETTRGSEGQEWITSESLSRRGSRDESAFYQAEATMLSRENQMLRQRIRELERQVSELTTTTSSGARPEEAAQPATEGTEMAGHHAPAEPTDKA